MELQSTSQQAVVGTLPRGQHQLPSGLTHLLLGYVFRAGKATGSKKLEAAIQNSGDALRGRIEFFGEMFAGMDGGYGHSGSPEWESMLSIFYSGLGRLPAGQEPG